jgi:molybdate/tungstate transport system substrate-binding protein
MSAPRITFALLCACLAAGCSRRTELVVFHAASLSRVLSDVAAQFEKENPSARVRLEPSGSEVAVRKITELRMRADLLMVADMPLLDPAQGGPASLLTAPLATNEIVLAHRDHSRFTESVTTANWPEVLLRDGVRLGCVNPTLAPIGYHTQFVWQLAELGGGYPSAGRDLAMRLNAHCARQIAPDETELVALLESRAVDYAFVYRTTAEDHHLKIVELPAEENLSRRELASVYARASLMLGAQGRAPRQLWGAPIVYGLAVPANAPHPDLARRFTAFLLGEPGQRAFDRAGFHAP